MTPSEQLQKILDSFPKKEIGILKLDNKNQEGYWFQFSEMSKEEINEILNWCKENFGKPTQMKGSLQYGWQPNDKTKIWTYDKVAKKMVIWDKNSAAIFIMYHQVK